MAHGNPSQYEAKYQATYGKDPPIPRSVTPHQLAIQTLIEACYATLDGDKCADWDSRIKAADTLLKYAMMGNKVPDGK